MRQEAIEAAEWECFSDPAYYDMWCVRQVGSRTFGEGFHLVNGDEAKMLCRFLNTRATAPALMEAGARLALEALGHIQQIVEDVTYCVRADTPKSPFTDALNEIHQVATAAIVKGAGEQ